jgi:hypothetical protein
MLCGLVGRYKFSVEQMPAHSITTQETNISIFTGMKLHISSELFFSLNVTIRVFRNLKHVTNEIPTYVPDMHCSM